MPVISLENVSMAYGHVALLDAVSLQLEAGERVCLVGCNGTGKSTLMRVLSGAVLADDGSVWRQPGIRVAHLEQEVPVDEQRSVFDVVAEGLGNLAAHISAYHRTTVELEREPSDELVQQLAHLQMALEAEDGWRLQQRVETVLTKLGLPADQTVCSLSGGAKRRVLMARALVVEPELLLLDEPTNHLDIDTIQWLEEVLLAYSGALLFITHDRAFLQRLATRIVELDRGSLTSWPGDYERYIALRQERLEVEAQHRAKFEKKLAQEETWIRQGIKARRTRNEGRVRALEALRQEHARRRELRGNARLSLDRGDTSGKLVLEAEHVSFGYEGATIVKDFSTRILRGDRVGVIGPNGCGKSTLIKLLLQRLAPDAGAVQHGSRLDVAFFDQERAQLDLNKSVVDNIGAGSDTVTINGQSKHVMSYLRDFLFPAERAQSPARSLSGGERNRLLLARLFTRPANLLVLDEPTNDLDMETLELLEELLADYDGTLILISHDRRFLDNVVTSTLAFEGEGRFVEYVGGYRDWLRQRQPLPADAPQIPRNAHSNAPPPAPPAPKPRKLSYREQRELDALPRAIEQLEAEQSALQARIAEPQFYRGAAADVATAVQRLEELGQQLQRSYDRWQELDER